MEKHFLKPSRRISENPQSETRPHSSPDPSCGREYSRGRADPYPPPDKLFRPAESIQISSSGFSAKYIRTLSNKYRQLGNIFVASFLRCWLKVGFSHFYIPVLFVQFDFAYSFISA
jgi:hypothetical protein